MRSRYSAYALGDSGYIIKTTHTNNPDYTTDMDNWSRSIDMFSTQNSFDNLEILKYSDGEVESFVSFRATISASQMVENSRFLKENGRWLYVDGDLQ